MAVETKPLFNPELIRKQAHVLTLPDSVEAARPRLQHWADLISSGKADTGADKFNDGLWDGFVSSGELEQAIQRIEALLKAGTDLSGDGAPPVKEEFFQLPTT